ncbi:MAG: class I SAM-dependent methyltransferase [Gammaproteobacteria bacterium]|nr:class I SAM-dependent methyltransferase [Gammaproteobacteria bacterium]
METRFADHFSGHAEAYARHRPDYPEALFATLNGVVPDRHRAWDVGCGNGQVARGLAEHFDDVIASDPSAAQLRERDRAPGVRYLQCPAAPSPLATGSCDLIAAGQALHWFPLESFYAEARRVLRPEGVVAAWCYSLVRIAPEIDPLVERFYRDNLGPWWPEQRAHVDAGYADLPFPFDELPVPRLEIAAEWDLDRLVAYLGTWSAYRRSREATGLDPLPALAVQLGRAWGDPGRTRRLRWPLHLRLGRA